MIREDLSNFLKIDTDPYCVIGLIFETDIALKVEEQLDDVGEFCFQLSEDDLAAAVEWTLEDDVLEVANRYQGDADVALESGLANSAKSVDYQAALVLFAIGLALSAWAALTDTADKVRIIFILLAVFALAGGLVQLVAI